MAPPPYRLSRDKRSSCCARGERKCRLRCWTGCFGPSPSSDVEEPPTNIENMQPLGHVEEHLLSSHGTESSAESQVRQFTLKEQEFPPLTIDDVKSLLDLVTAQVALNGSQSSASKILRETISKYGERKEALNSLIKSLPSDLKQKVVGGGKDVLMPLLTSALGGAGNIHWIGFGLRLIAWSLESIHDTMQNKQDCLQILSEVVDFMKSLLEIWEKTSDQYKDNTNPELQKIIEIVFSCAIICASTMNDPAILRLVGAQQVKGTINDLKNNLAKAKTDALFYMQKWQICELPKVPQQIRIEPSSYNAKKVGGDEGKNITMEFFRSMESNDMIAVCLHGMGGIGKSFTGSEIFREFQESSRWQQYRRCRVELKLDIKDGELVNVQNDILRNLCGPDAANASDCLEGQSKLIQEMKKLKDPVLLYLDNVLECDHLEKLLPEASCFPKGSKLLVTSRGADILGGIKAIGIKVVKMVEITVLQDKEAKELLWKQMGEERDKVIVSSNGPLEALEEDVLKLCGGLPLALKVVGGCIASDELRPTDARVWKRVVEAMEKAEPLSGKSRDPLYTRIGYSIECLNPAVKRAFLDIVAFSDPFLNEWKIIKRMVGHSHLKVLQQCNLVQKTRSSNILPTLPATSIKIHDVLLALARKMINDDTDELRIEGRDNFNQLSGDDLGKVVSLKQVDLHASMLTQMRRLRFLKAVWVEGECEMPAQLSKLLAVDSLWSETGRLLNLSGCACLKHMEWAGPRCNASDLECLRHATVSAALEALELSQWGPLEDVGVVETLKSLKRLHFCGCPGIARLPQGIAGLTNLKQLSLTVCSGLADLPDGMTGLTGLRVLDLSDCQSLKMLPERIGNLTRLTCLCLHRCSAITRLPEGIRGLESLTELDLSGCSSLQCLPEGISGLTRLQVLDLTHSNLEWLPEAGVEGLKSLRRLIMRCCYRLGCLPRGIAGMTSLETLDLGGCSSLMTLPDELACLRTCLVELKLAGCTGFPNVLPPVLKTLTSLSSLDLHDCRTLQSIEAVTTLTRLVELDISRCHALQSLPAGFGGLTGLTSLNLAEVSSLKAGLHELKSLTGLQSIISLPHCEAIYALMEAGDFSAVLGMVKGSATVTWRGCLPYLPESLTAFTSLEVLAFFGDGVILPCLPQELTTLTALKNLLIKDCETARCLPPGFTSLRSLQRLTWIDCRSLQSLKEIAGLTGLDYLGLSGCASQDDSMLKEVWTLTGLTEIWLGEWVNMRALPKGVASSLERLRDLSLSGWTSLVSLPEELASLSSLKSLGLADCKSLECLPLALSARLPDLQVYLEGCTRLVTFKAMQEQSTSLTWAKVSYLVALHPTLFQAREAASSAHI